MAPRIRFQIVAAGEDDTPDAPAFSNEFHALIVLEEVETGDKRYFTEGSLTWRDLPFPLMARDTDEHGGMGADTKTTLVGNFERIERRGTEIHGYGSWISEPEGDALRLIGLVQRGELRGLSADVDAVEYEVLVPIGDEPAADDTMESDDMALEAEPLPRETRNGVEYEVIAIDQPIERVTEGRVMGATVVPFQAFMEAFIEPAEAEAKPEPEPAAEPEAAPPDAIAASVARLAQGGIIPDQTAVLRTDGPREAAPVRFNFPAIPPRGWFDVPEAPGPMPLTILDSGQVFGHIALWGECHIGISGECVEPPPSFTNYARFHMGECPTDDGSRVAVGHLTFATGHADGHYDPARTRSHYDDTGTVAADVIAMDGEYGIWVCGAARSTLTDADVREVMSAPPSGDWRRFGQHLEMVAALCVNVPGYGVQRSLAASAYARVRIEDGLVNSLIVAHPARASVTASAAPSLDPALARQIRERIAATIGRSTSQRIEALTARVHGGN